MPDDDAKCVYVLGSESQPGRFYTGITSDLSARLVAHNRGDSVHTATGCPWRVVVALVFADPRRAQAFERYLKSGSGRAFAERYFR
jgi:putative endonuclease